MAAKITTTMNFLARESVYDEEKPYLLIFSPPEGFPRTNVRLDKRHDVTLEDIRGRENEFTLARHGFQLIKFKSALSYEDFHNEQLVQSVYLSEIAEKLRKTFAARRVQVFEHLIRKTQEIFPISTGEPYQYNQPTSIAHIDITPEGTVEMVKQLNQSNAAELLKSRVVCVNVWKPLRDPVLDWPLGLCDAKTVDIADLHPGDLVYDDHVMENSQLHYNTDQRWYFVRNQRADEAWIFVQSDSDAEATRGGGTPHSSFPMSTGDSTFRRESIEARCLVYI